MTRSIDLPVDPQELPLPDPTVPVAIDTATDSSTDTTQPTLGALPPVKSKVARTLDIVRNRFRLVFSSDKRVYAVDDSTPNPQTWRVDSPGFASAVQQLVHLIDPTLVLTGDERGQVREHIEALGELTGTNETVSLRVARTAKGLVIDQGDDTHARIQVEPGAVQVLKTGCPTLFYRSPNFLPYPTPASKGDIGLLLPYLNLEDSGQRLLIGWITYTLAHAKVSSTNYVHLVLRGDRGTGKSTMCNVFIGSLVGPSTIGVQSFPGSQRDLAIAVQNAHVAMYDNLRRLTPLQADMLCRCSTSAAVSTRKLYTDGLEYTHTLHGALVLNGIHSFIDQPDLAQRCLVLTLLPLDPAARSTESQLRARFQQDLPAIFRGVLDLIAEILRHLPTVTAKYPERMLEFVHWLAAMEKAQGLPEGELQKAYRDNLVAAMVDSLEDNPLADAVLQFAQQHAQAPWTGTPTDLLLELGKLTTREIITSTGWPQNEVSLSLRLKKLKSQLSGAGVEIAVGKRSKLRQVTVRYTGRSS